MLDTILRDGYTFVGTLFLMFLAGAIVKAWLDSIASIFRKDK